MYTFAGVRREPHGWQLPAAAPAPAASLLGQFSLTVDTTQPGHRAAAADGAGRARRAGQPAAAAAAPARGRTDLTRRRACRTRLS